MAICDSSHSTSSATCLKFDLGASANRQQTDGGGEERKGYDYNGIAFYFLKTVLGRMKLRFKL